ncbi:unnamed protein product, partial [Polarella glacialis]
MAPPPGTTTRHTVVRPGMPAHLDPRGPGRPFGRPPADGPPPERPPPPVRQVPSPSLRPQEEHLKPTPPSVMGDSVWGDDSSLPQEFGGSGPALNVFPELGGSGPQSKKDRKQALLANLAANQAADSSKVSKPAEAPWSQASRGTGSYSLEALAKGKKGKGKGGQEDVQRPVGSGDAGAYRDSRPMGGDERQQRPRRERGQKGGRADDDADYRRDSYEDGAAQEEARPRGNRRDRERAEREEFQLEKRDDGSRRDRPDNAGRAQLTERQGPGGRNRRNLRTSASDSEGSLKSSRGEDDEEDRHTLWIDPQKPPRILQKPPEEKPKPKAPVVTPEEKPPRERPERREKGKGKGKEAAKEAWAWEEAKAEDAPKGRGGKAAKGAGRAALPAKGKGRGRRTGGEDSDEAWAEASASEEEDAEGASEKGAKGAKGAK